MKRKITKAAQRLADNWNAYIQEHREKTERKAKAIRRKRYAEDLTAQRRARYYARKEREVDDGEEIT
jgi:hypothetical protein